MKDTIQRMEKIITDVSNALEQHSPETINLKPVPNKWSKKEILGHLVDSGYNNLKRFVECQYLDAPYAPIDYNPDESVRVNGYQEQEIEVVFQLWKAINLQIIEVIKRMPEEVLDKELHYQGNHADIRFLVNDYADHLNHHAQQIIG